MGSLLWILCREVFVVESLVWNRCRGIVVVKSLLCSLCCGSSGVNRCRGLFAVAYCGGLVDVDSL